MLILPRFSDVFGRRRLSCLCQVLDTLLMTSMFFVTNVYVMLVVLFLFGCVATLRMNVQFIWLAEL